MTWTKGRNLTTYDGVSFAYNALGKRTSKGSIKYLYSSSGKLIKQSNGLEFMYDASGLAAIEYDTKTYLYRKDAQGNITALLDKTGNVVVKYVYDAWGNQQVQNPDGSINTNTDFIGNLNPFRYRGYYFDTETGLYFLQTRYYDPTIGRFINADDISYLDPESINGLNLYAYCLNNPIKMVDSDGNKPKWWQWLLFGIGVALVVAAAVVLVVASGGAASGLVGAVAVGAAKGTLIGAAVGSVVGMEGGAIYAGVTGADMGQSILSGFLIGFGGGAIIGAAIGAAVGAATYTPSGLSKMAINKGVKNFFGQSNKVSKMLGKPMHNLSGYTAKTANKLMTKTLINGTVGTYNQYHQLCGW